MSVIINCTEPLTLSKDDLNGYVTIKYKDIEIEIQDNDISILFEQVKFAEFSGEEIKKTCKIRIIYQTSCTRITFRYPYELNELASSEFDKLASSMSHLLYRKI